MKRGHVHHVVERFTERQRAQLVPPGQYYLGWIVTTDSQEASAANNTAILLRGYGSGFAKVTITVV